MTAFLARDPIEPAVVDTLCRTHGLTHVRNEPWTNGIVYTQWSDGDATVTLACDGRSEAQVLRLDGAPAALGDAIARDFELEALDDTLELARNASAPLDKIRRLYRAHAFRLVGGEPDRRVVALQCEHLLDEHAWVRWAAARLLAHRATTEVLAAFEEAQSRHGDLERTLERVRAQCAAASDGTLFDEPTDAWDELIRRAREGLEDGKPQRAAKAMDTLLRDSSDHIEGLLLRARAHGAEGDRLVALALLGAAEATAKVEREVRDGKGLAEIERLLKEIVAARDELEDGSGDEATLVAWLTRWAEDGRDTAACGAALAVIDDVPALAGVLSYIAGRYRHDRRRLELARQRAPRSPWCLRALANVQKTDRPAEAVALYEEALTCLNVTDKKREEALIDRLGTALLSSQLAGAPSLEALLLEDLAGLHYDERNWDEAMRHADRLVVTNPKCLTAWQWRANARTFARQHEDAVAAYREAIEVLDEAFDGDGMVVGSDPRPGMHFNLACVLAKLEHHDEALDELRRAVRGDAKWGAEAKSDDYFESLWEDATFARVVSGDPNALVLDEERDPTFIDSLINRATGHCHRGSYSAAIETAERAVRLAKRNEDASLAARGLSVHARALALSGQAELGVAKAVEARALADEGNASARVRSEVAHELGVALHAAGNHDRAADAYQHALELRKEAYGSEHPIVAKSLGDLARLASDRGEPTLELCREGIAILEGFLKTDDGDRDVHDEARLDLAILQSNLAESLRKAGDIDAALDALCASVDTMEVAIKMQIPMGQPFLDHAINLGERLVRGCMGAKAGSHEDDQRLRARGLVSRLESLLVDGSDAERQERMFWRRLRRFVRNTTRGGVPEATLARTLSEALRGGKRLPKPVQRIPEIAGFAKALAERATRYPTLLAMSVMALSTAEANGNLDDALANLEELCVAALVEGSI